MAQKIQILQEALFHNSSEEPIELMVPVGEKARVHFDQGRFSFEVKSSEREPASVILQPGDRVELIG